MSCNHNRISHKMKILNGNTCRYWFLNVLTASLSTQQNQEHCVRPPPALLLVLNLLERKKIFSQQVYIITKFITCTFCHRPSLSSLVMPPHSLVPDLLPGPWSHLEEIISSFTVLKSSWHYWFTGSCWQLGSWALRKLQVWNEVAT